MTTSISNTRACRAKDKAACPYHGIAVTLEAAMNAASEANDLAAYGAAKEKLELRKDATEVIAAIQQHDDDRKSNRDDRSIIQIALDAEAEGSARDAYGVDATYRQLADGTYQVDIIHTPQQRSFESVSEAAGDPDEVGYASEFEGRTALSDAEAEEIADQLNAAAEDNLSDNDYFGTTDTDSFEDNFVRTVSENVFGNTWGDFDDARIERVFKFTSTVKPFDLFTGEDVSRAWESYAAENL